MDATLEKIYAIKPDGLEKRNQQVMLGSGGHGICFTKGKGVRLTDVNGKSYLDCTSQGWALLLGHANEEIREAVYEQMGMLSHLNQNSDSLPRYALAERLLTLAPQEMDRVMFTIGGSAAIEAAMKLAALNVPGGRKFITLKDGYHGTSLTTGAGSWVATRTAGIFTGYHRFSAIYNDIFLRVPNPYLYRYPGDEEGCVAHCLAEAEETLASRASGQVAGIIVEPLQASGGQIPLPPAYLQGLRRLADAFGCLLIFDELQTFCRIGHSFAAQKYGVQPDIICLGKSLGAGLPIAAVLLKKGLTGFSPLGDDVHTFSNNSLAQVAGLKQLDIIARDSVLDHTNEVGGYLGERLRAMQGRYPCLGDVRQVGLHIGLEFVSDPESKAPDIRLAQTVKQIALQMGLILGEAGYRLNVLKIKPPLIITREEADEVLSLLETAVKATLAQSK